MNVSAFKVLLPMFFGKFLLAAAPADILLRNATIFDGTGKPGSVADVAIVKDVISNVGVRLKVSAKKVIEAKGLVLSPGFIDLHNHSDTPESETSPAIPLFDPKTRSNLNYLTQGVTTIVTGNCGDGPTDVREFLSKVESGKVGTNVAHLIPHNSLREKVMGNVNRAPTSEELASMEASVAQGMKDGAWGMSTGLYYTPGSYAKTDEIIALAKVVAKEKGFYASHMRSEGPGLLESVDETIKISREAGLPVHISHFKADEPKSWPKMAQAISEVKKARRAGVAVTADQYPYTAASTSLSAEVIPTEFREGTDEEVVARLTHPEKREAVLKAIGNMLKFYEGGKNIVIASYAPRRDWQGKDILSIASAEKVSVPELVVSIQSKGGARVVSHCMSEANVLDVMKQDFVATASDGRSRVPDESAPHPRSYGTFPRKIAYYSKDKKVISVAQAIRSSTSLPARIMGLSRRGEIKVGYFADLVVFDPSVFCDVATYEKPHQYSQGVKYLLVNGVLTIDDGKYTGALAGSALRHPVVGLP